MSGEAPHVRGSRDRANDVDAEGSWRPRIFDRTLPEDARELDALLASGRLWAVHDTLEAQLRDLADARRPERDLTTTEMEEAVRAILGGTSRNDYGRWVHYPWSGRLVHVLPPEEFRELRLDRNRYKLTREEQARLAQVTVGIAGLSVGNAVALTLALEGACGHLKLADFDRLELSNMNRIRAGVHEIGLPKTVLAARHISELDPYARVTLFPEGLTPDNLDAFLREGPRLDVVIDECDTIFMKFMLRERARELRLPVLMETSDRGLLDVERFDLEPARPLFHGLTGATTSQDVRRLPTKRDRAGVVLDILGARTLSTRMAASMVDVDETISAWPQLGSDVTLGGATTTAAVRRLALGEPLPSGRRYVDLQHLLDTPGREPAPIQGSDVPAACPHPGDEEVPAASSQGVPEEARVLVEHAILAPSGGNVQPWRFHYDGGALWLVHDAARARNLLDVGHRASLLALGAALENTLIAAAHRGLRARVEPFPHPRAPSVVAAVHLERAGGEDKSLAALFPLLRLRATNRRLAPRVPLTPGERTALRDAAASRGAHLLLCEEDGPLAELGELLGEGDRIRFLCPALHREVMGELRWSPEEAARTRDGIHLGGLELTASEAAAMRMLARPDVSAALRARDGGQALRDIARRSVRAASAVGLLLLGGDSPMDWLQGGRALQRTWLEATRLGLALHPMSALPFLLRMLETERAEVFLEQERVRLLELGRRLDGVFDAHASRPRAFLFRLAHAPAPTERSLRLPVERVLRLGPPPIAEG